MSHHQRSLLCESQSEARGRSGCCANGKTCDTVCANLAALQECSQPLIGDEQYGSSSCCDDPSKSDSTTLLSNTRGREHVASTFDDQPQDKLNKITCTNKSQVGTHVHGQNNGVQSIQKPECCKKKDESKHTCCGAKVKNEVGDKQKQQNQEAKPSRSIKPPVSTDITNTCCMDDGDNNACLSPCDKEEPRDNRDQQTAMLAINKASCPVRFQRALEKYHKLLEQGLCICRSVLEGTRPCCSKADRAAYMGDSQKSAHEERMKSDCGSKMNLQQYSSVNQNNAVITDSFNGRVCLGRPLLNKKDCCIQKDESSEMDGSCRKMRSCEDKGAHSKQISNISEEEITTSNIKPDVPSVNAGADLEKGDSSEHVVVSIQGMTCTSCARTITNVLTRLPGTSDVNINFMTAKGEFRLAHGYASATDLISQLKRETGFEFIRLETGLQTLDLSMSSETAKAWAVSSPDGIDSVERFDKIWRITYDPAIIGARTVFERSGAQSLGAPQDDAALSAGKRKLLKMFLSFGIALIFTLPVVVLEWGDNSVPYGTRSIISIVFATIVQAVAIPEFYLGAIKSLIYSRVVEMDMLVTISTMAAYVYSIVAFALTHAGYVLEQGEFFETSTLLITLVILGRLISAYAKHRAVAAVSFKSLQVDKAQLVSATGQTQEIDARLLEYGDILLVSSHSRIVTDGEITNGTSSVDESMHTGESVPVLKEVGDQVTAGTINGEGILTIRLTRLPGKNSITDIAGLVEAALNTKPRVQDLADKIAGYFIPTVVLIAVVVFAIWIAVGFKLRGMSGGSAVGTAITYAIAVLAVSCPCALGLAVPMVLVIAGGLGARSGVIIKRADATERSYKVTDVVFDKTGTLTYGELQVQKSIIIGTVLSAGEAAILTHGLVKDNKHPVSAAVAKSINIQSEDKELDSIQSLPGKGFQATWRGKTVCAGNPYWLELSEHEEVSPRIQAGETLFCLTIDSNLVALYSLKATIRSEALTVVRELQSRGISCHIVSGDGPLVVADVAKTLTIVPENAMSCQSPSEKQSYVQKLMEDGKYVLFCGDGTNDAVAVAQAHVGLQIGNTSDVTKATSDVILLGGLEGVVKLLDISKAAYRRIVFNFAWSAIYNIFAILLAAGAFVTVRIPPAYAGLGEIVSILPVVLAGLTLLL